jgi:hypothetical protein
MTLFNKHLNFNDPHPLFLQIPGGNMLNTFNDNDSDSDSSLEPHFPRLTCKRKDHSSSGSLASSPVSTSYPFDPHHQQSHSSQTGLDDSWTLFKSVNDAKSRSKVIHHSLVDEKAAPSFCHRLKSDFVKSMHSSSTRKVAITDDDFLAAIDDIFRHDESQQECGLLDCHQASSRQEHPPSKKIKHCHETHHDLLHRSCLRSDITVSQVQHILKIDPHAASRSLVLETYKKVVNPLTCQCEIKLVKEPFTYPLHLAIRNQASTEVVQALIQAAPAVLMIRDGPMKDTPLSLALKFSPDLLLVDTMLLVSPKCVTLRDRHDNTVLHVACRHGVSTTVLRHLCILCQKALYLKNFHGKTPLELVQERSVNKYSESMCNFLMDLMQQHRSDSQEIDHDP